MSGWSVRVRLGPQIPFITSPEVMNLKSLSDRVAAKFLGVPKDDVPGRVASRFMQRQAAEWEGKFVGKDCRLQWSRGYWKLEELPQKGKKKLKVADLQNPNSYGTGLDWWIPENILMLAKLSPSDDFEKVKSKISDAYKKAEEKTANSKYDREREMWEKAKSWVSKLDWHVSDVFYLNVIPEGVGPFTAEGKDFTMKVEWTGFSAFSPDTDMQLSDPHYTKYEEKSPAAARKLYQILKTDPAQLKSVSWSGLGDWLKKNGVAYDIRFSQW